MAVPKKRQSQSRSRMRRAHDALTLTNLAPCSHCKELIMPHKVCPACGYYGKKKVLQTKAA